MLQAFARQPSLPWPKEDLVIVHGRLKVASAKRSARGARRAQRCRFRRGIDGAKVEASDGFAAATDRAASIGRLLVAGIRSTM